jgi:hypothetical protein
VLTEIPASFAAKVTLQLSVSASMNRFSFLADQPFGPLARFCGRTPPFRTSPAIHPSATQKGPDIPARPRRIAILHCSLHVPDERDDVKMFLPFWFVPSTGHLPSPLCI